MQEFTYETLKVHKFWPSISASYLPPLVNTLHVNFADLKKKKRIVVGHFLAVGQSMKPVIEYKQIISNVHGAEAFTILCYNSSINEHV